MEKKGFSKKIIVSILAIVVVIGAIFFLKKPSAAKFDGTVEIEIVDIKGKQINNKEIGYKEGDTLVTLVEDNFENVKIQDGFLYTIDALTTPDDWSTFIAIYVDDKMSEVGISEIELKDGEKISFIDTEMKYE